MNPITSTASVLTPPVPVIDPSARRCRLAVAAPPSPIERPAAATQVLAWTHRAHSAVWMRLFTVASALYIAWSRRSAHRAGRPPGDRRDRGQATTEYALILLAAALVGLMVVAWATAGGGAARISRLFNGVIDAVIDKV